MKAPESPITPPSCLYEGIPRRYSALRETGGTAHQIGESYGSTLDVPITYGIGNRAILGGVDTNQA